MQKAPAAIENPSHRLLTSVLSPGAHPWYNHRLSVKTGMCLRKWSLDVCLIWTSSATEHTVQKSMSNPDKATAASLSRSPKGLKRIKHQRLISREMFSAHGLLISSNSLFHRSFAALFLATQNSLATSWVWRSHEGKGCGGWALFANAVVLYFWTTGCFFFLFTHGNFTLVITATNGHPNITGRFWIFHSLPSPKMWTGSLEVTLTLSSSLCSPHALQAQFEILYPKSSKTASAMKHTRSFEPFPCLLQLQSVSIGLSTAPSPDLTAPPENTGKTPFGFSRVWLILNAAENTSLKCKMSKAKKYSVLEHERSGPSESGLSQPCRWVRSQWVGMMRSIA